MSCKIYVMTHKKFNPPPNPIYIPLQVGREGKEALGYLADHTGDSISALNPYYSELTGIYWVWKNCKDKENVGICHYRRYLLNEEGELFTEEQIDKLLNGYDVITTKLLTLNHSYLEAFGGNHNQADLLLTGEAIDKLCPEYKETFDRIIKNVHTYFGNMMIMSGKLFDSYCTWLFAILFETQKHVNMEGYDAYQKRLYGFLSEILFFVWVEKNHLKVKECMVGMSGEKAETREIKERLAGFFAAKDISGAKSYFLESYQKRPDILMEASDTFGELKLSVQIISTCEFQLAETGSCILDKIQDFHQLIQLFGKINHIIEKAYHGEISSEERDFLKTGNVDEIMLRIAAQIVCETEKEAEMVAGSLIKCFADK